MKRKKKELTKEDIQKFWDVLFPLREGQKVILLKDTQFTPYGEQGKKTRAIKKGTIGTVIEYQEGHPLVRVDFGIPKWNYLLEVKRVKRI